MSAALHEIKTDNKERFDSLESKVNSLEKSIKETVIEESKLMKEEIKDDLSSDICQVKSELAEDISKLREEFKEELDRKLKEKDDLAKRERNLFMYKIPESDSSVPKVRIAYDKDFVSRLCSELGVEDPKIGSLVRFGKVKRNEKGEIDTSTPRPLRVTFLEKSERRLVLTKAKTLRSVENQAFHEISISRDLSEAEKKKHKDLEQELKSSTEAGESDLRIVRGRIVKTSNKESARPTPAEGQVSQEQS